MPVDSTPASGVHEPFLEVPTEQEREEEAKKSYFSKGENGSPIFSDGFMDFKRKKHPAHRPTGSTQVLTFYPTREEFKDFTAYIEKIEEAAAHTKCGIAKIVPPEGWNPRPSKHNFHDVDSYEINAPVKEIMTRVVSGIYQKSNEIYKMKMSVKEFKSLANKTPYKTPAGVNAMTPKQLENYFFDHLEDGEPIYGADTEGSIYDEGITEFNMNKLGTILDEYANDNAGEVIRGVNSVYLYFGMYKTCFPWHSEDMDLYSINYLHFGAPKYWFAIPAEAADRFEKVMDQYYPEWKSACPAYVRHKLCMISPEILKVHGIPYGTMVQRPNEFIITFPRGYHMGFNTGYNCAESTNFALERWLDYGKNSLNCRCKDGVILSMQAYMRRYRAAEFSFWYNYWFDNDRPLHITLTPYPPEVEPLYKKSRKNKENEKETIKKSDKLKRKRGNWMRQMPEMYSRSAPNLFKEKQENKEASYMQPHCSVCTFFLPKNQTVKVEEIPQRSKRYTKSIFFTKGPPPYPENDPKEDILLTCENCLVTVHPSCYGGDVEDATNWRCFRCRDRNDVAIRHRCCTLCDMRGGAFIPCQTGIDNGFIHVTCGIMNRRTSFNAPIGPSQCFLYPNFIHKPKEGILEKLRYQYIIAESDLPETSRWECELCEVLREGLLICSLCYETVEDRFRTMCHASCGKKAGFFFEERAYPQCTVMICDKHIFEGHDEDIIPEGTRVFLLHNGEIDDGEIRNVNTFSQLCAIKLDGAYVSNINPNNVASCSCCDRNAEKTEDEHTEHKEGARLQIRTENGQLEEEVYYRRQNTFAVYTVVLESGKQVKCQRDELFRVGGAKMPNSVKKKVNEYVCHPSRKARFPMYFH